MRVPILMYHKVASLPPSAKIPAHYVEPALFDRQMRLLRALKFEAIPLTRLFSETTPGRRVVITFDDGYENYYSEARPVLEGYDLPATVFLVSNQVGGTNLWDSKDGEVSEKLMDRSHIRAAADGLTEFGSHTADHVDLSTAEPQVARYQVLDSKRALESDLGLPIDTFCYPYGKKTPQIETLVAASGYAWACSTEKGANDENTNPMALKRINVRRETSGPVFLYKLWRSIALGK